MRAPHVNSPLRFKEMFAELPQSFVEESWEAWRAQQQARDARSVQKEADKQIKSVRCCSDGAERRAERKPKSPDVCFF